MNRRIAAFTCASALAVFAAGSTSLAAEETKPPMHMHRANVMEKMGASSVAHLVKMHLPLEAEA